MSDFIVTTHTTGSQGLGLGDTIYIPPFARMISRSIPILRNSNSVHNMSAFVDGTVVSTTGDAILLDGTALDGTGNNHVSIGQTGIVRSLKAMGIQIDGDDSSVINDGAIYAKTRGIYNLDGDSFSLINSGLISADIGVVPTGLDTDVQILGTIESLYHAVWISISGGTLTNSGQLTGREAVYLQGSDGEVFNSGQIVASLTGIRYGGSSARIVNSGAIMSGGEGVLLDPFAVLPGSFYRLLNAGSITAKDAAIAITGSAANLQNYGTIASAGGYAVVSDRALTMVNDGIIAGGTAANGTSIAISVIGTCDEFIRNFGTITGSVLTGAGNDVIRNNGDIQREVNLGNGADLYIGGREAGDVTLQGGDQRDVILSGGGDDNISGGNGDDVLRGGLGDDTIYGGSGADALTGGGGADLFVFGNAAELFAGANLDSISDFKSGLAQIELGAFMPGGSFIGVAAFFAANQVRYESTTGIVQGDLNGDLVADRSLVLTSKPGLTATDFIFRHSGVSLLLHARALKP